MFLIVMNVRNEEIISERDDKLIGHEEKIDLTFNYSN